VLINGGYFSNVIAIAPYKNISSKAISETEKRIYPGLTTDFWKHGQAGLIDIADDIKPTKWYGKVHPFEFEFIVGDNPFE
jgi:oligoribonuclease (3'-5' exoribonuclease)